MGVDDPEQRAKSVDSGVRVDLRYTYYYTTDDTVADSPTIHVARLVTDRPVYRAESEGYETPEGGLDPKSGAVVACRGAG